MWLLRTQRHRAQGDATTEDWVDRLRNRLTESLQRLCRGAGARGGRLRHRDNRDRRRRRPPTRAGDLSRRRRPPVPVALPGSGRHKVRIDRAAGRRCAGGDQAGRRAGQRRHHAGIRRRATLVISDQHRLPVDRWIAGRRVAGGAQSRTPPSASPISKKTFGTALPGSFPTHSSRSSRATSWAGS